MSHDAEPAGFLAAACIALPTSWIDGFPGRVEDDWFHHVVDVVRSTGASSHVGTRSVRPEAIAGVTCSVLWIRTQLYQTVESAIMCEWFAASRKPIKRHFAPITINPAQ